MHQPLSCTLDLSLFLSFTGCTKEATPEIPVDERQLANAMADFYVDCTWKVLIHSSLGFISEADPNYPLPEDPNRESIRTQF